MQQSLIDPENFVFTQDYMFTSPSAASAVILGRASNGRTAWREVNTNLTYSEWQQKQVDSA